jgi:hypothetical protein
VSFENTPDQEESTHNCKSWTRWIGHSKKSSEGAGSGQSLSQVQRRRSLAPKSEKVGKCFHRITKITRFWMLLHTVCNTLKGHKYM